MYPSWLKTALYTYVYNNSRQRTSPKALCHVKSGLVNPQTLLPCRTTIQIDASLRLVPIGLAVSESIGKANTE